MKDDGKNNKPVISFIVTGFGPFGNVSENPTMAIINRLGQYLQDKDEERDLASRTRTFVMETSAQAARAAVDNAMTHLSSSDITVLLHLGVNYEGTTFQVEQCAYNDATFRIPDEQGYQPKNQCVVESVPLKTCLQTSLDVERLCNHLQDDLVVLSTDPGRFVCNYTYLYSLHKTQQLKNPLGGQVHCLFLHVPPFSVVPEEEQMQVVVTLMQCIDDELSCSTVPVASSC